VRERQREETRKKLYHAAIEVFCRDGVDACRIEDIALKAEVSRAAFYFHFPTKDDVLHELTRDSEVPMVEALSQLADDAPLSETFAVLVKGLSEFWQEGDRKKLLIDVFATALRRLRTLAEDREAEPMRSIVGTRFRLASERGELSPMIPPEVVGDFFLLNCLAALASWGVSPVLPLDQVLNGVVMLFMNGAQGPTPISIPKVTP
jgi:AcrR family transcriptional regulator